jgi:hypothetical protein
MAFQGATLTIRIHAQMLAHQTDPEGTGKASDLVRSTGHRAVDQVGIADDAGQLRIAIAALRSLVDIGRPDDDDPVIDHHALPLTESAGTAKRRSERTLAWI